MEVKRKLTKKIKIGSTYIGGNEKIAVQSMTNTDTRDIDSTVKQIHELENAGCDIVRISVYDNLCAKAVKEIKKQIDIPLVADIHFDYKLAIESIESGIDKLRINPGNIGGKDRVQRLVACAKEHNVPIRIGVNSGSLQKDIIENYGITAKGMVESAMQHIHILEDCGFYDIVISLKSSDVLKTIESYRLMSQTVNYPLHVGVTEAGISDLAVVKSSIGIGSLLLNGIGDTIRVSLTGNPVKEVIIANDILKSLDINKTGIDIISCPTCGRTSINVEKIAEIIGQKFKNVKVPLKIAVMGCVVNGPGEAKEADIGLAGGKGSGMLFKHGEMLRKVSEDELLPEFIKEIESVIIQKTDKKLQ